MRMTLNCFNSFMFAALAAGATSTQVVQADSQPMLRVHLEPADGADIGLPENGYDFDIYPTGGESFTGFSVKAYKYTGKGTKVPAGGQSYGLAELNAGFDFDAKRPWANLLFIKGNNLSPTEGGTGALVHVAQYVRKAIKSPQAGEKHAVQTTVSAGAAGAISAEIKGVDYGNEVSLKTVAHPLALAHDAQGWHLTENDHAINYVRMVIGLDSKEKDLRFRRKVVTIFKTGNEKL